MFYILHHVHPPNDIFFFNDTATTEIYTLSLHDALPILQHNLASGDVEASVRHRQDLESAFRIVITVENRNREERSEEHTSELQSHLNIVCRLLLEKKKYETK